MLHLFLPHKSAANIEHLVAAGLGDLVRPNDQRPQCVDLDGLGPGGLPGQVWSWEFPRYIPDKQTWHQARGADYWYGFDHGDQAETVLRRRQTFDGVTHTLGDGQRWLVPSVDHVPHRFDLDAAGRLCRRPDPAYAQFVTTAGDVLADFTRNQETATWTPERAFGFVLSALALNYRINAEIACRLNLFGDDNLWGIALHVGQADEVRKIIADLTQKKSAAGPPG